MWRIRGGLRTLRMSLKHVVSQSLLSRPLCPVNPPAVPLRVFNTTTARGPYDSDDRESNDGQFSDPHVDYPFYGAKTHTSPGVDCSHKNFKGRETMDGVFMRIDIPGVGKENIKVRVKNDTFVLEGEGQKDFGDGELGLRYDHMIQLVGVQRLNIYEVTTKISNGVLKECVPKFKVKATTNVVRLTM